MDPNGPQAAQVRARLDEEKARLLAELEALDDVIVEDGPISQSGDAPVDTTTAETRRGVRASLERQLTEVDAAFGRVADGSYGIDEVTGEPIDPARLDAIPTARTNIGS